MPYFEIIRQQRPKLKAVMLAIAIALTSNTNAATFDNHVENGTFNQANNTSNTFTNNLTVNGNWNLNSIGSNTNMFFSGAQTIGGTGSINLTDYVQNRIYSSGNNLLTVGSNTTIRGAGQLGLGITYFDNLGSILAQGSNTLTIDSASFANNGTLRAEGSGGLVITGTNLDNNTSVDVNSGSKLQLISSTVDGVFNNIAGGTMTATAVTFDGATINGVMTQANNTTNTFTSGLTVNGAWNLNSAGSLTNMIFSGAQTIDGSGAIAL
ncbi:MAG: hypothetical protein GY731_16470, partial [Gammaproteobacteria bacterium]|nr:hypothetical protein [Gammaproteobacteria bacterium]